MKNVDYPNILDITLDDSPPTSPAINGTDGDTLPIGESSRVNNGVSIIPDDDDDHDEDDDDDDVICISDSDDEPAPKRTRYAICMFKSRTLYRHHTIIFIFTTF